MGQDETKRAAAKQAIEEVAKSNKFEVLGWRLVPVEPKVLGKLALANSPWVEQLVLKSTAGLVSDDLEKALYGVQRSTQTAVRPPCPWCRMSHSRCCLPVALLAAASSCKLVRVRVGLNVCACPNASSDLSDLMCGGCAQRRLRQIRRGAGSNTAPRQAEAGVQHASLAPGHGRIARSRVCSGVGSHLCGPRGFGRRMCVS